MNVSDSHLRRRIGWFAPLAAALALIAALGLGAGGAAAFSPIAKLIPGTWQDGATEAAAVISEVNNSGISGSATIESQNGTAIIRVTLTGPTPGSYPGHLHLGTCDELEPIPTIPLTDAVVGGTSMTTLDVSVDELLAESYVIIVHIQSDDLDELLNPESYLACGEIVPADSIPADPTPAAPTPTDAIPANGPPDSGIGTAAMHMQSGGIALWLALLAVGLGAAALTMRRWEANRQSVRR